MQDEPGEDGMLRTDSTGTIGWPGGRRIYATRTCELLVCISTLRHVDNGDIC
jgi:hypothetical protein